MNSRNLPYVRKEEILPLRKPPRLKGKAQNRGIKPIRKKKKAH